MAEDHNDTMDVDGDKVDDDIPSDASTIGSDDMDSPKDEAQEKEWNKRKTQLQEKLEKDKTDYYAYTELIDVLKSLGDLDELRIVREKFNKEYPLTPEMWLAWIEDEKNLATTEDEMKHVETLFERALQDYMSIDVWIEYGQFSIGRGMDNVRSVLERALSIAGLHAAKGKLLWDLYRESESFVLESLEEANPGEETDDIKTQKKRIAELFRRQLAVPLMEMEQTYQEMRQWLDIKKADDLFDMELLENSYKKALEKLSRILTFEESLQCSENEASIPIYQKYLQFEKNPAEGGNNSFRVRCLYERAITDNPLNAEFWYGYIDFINTVIRIPEDVLSVCHCAIRNCPNQANFWRYYMLAMERYNKSKIEIKEILNKSFENPYSKPSDYKNLWLSYIHYLIRQMNSIPEDNKEQRHQTIEDIRTVLNMAYENLMQFFGTSGDPDADILLLWARFEAEKVKDLEAYRKIWTDILNQGHKQSVVYWIRYINMEWQYGDAKHFRKLCERALVALVSANENPKSVASLWLEYESHMGSLDSFQNCQRICEEKIRQYWIEKKKAKDSNEDKKKMPTKKKVKEDDKFVKPEPPKPKGIVSVKNESPPKPKKLEPLTAPSNTFISHDSSKDDRTIFVSNLDYTVTEEQVKNIVSAVGTVVEFRLVRDFKGRSKGFGYLVFASRKEAAEALKLDRTPINQRPIFISECDSDRQSRKTGLRFNTGLEKNKLFIRGLPLNLDKEGVENIFKQYGKLKDIRLVTYRNGHSKGLAYVEFEDETSAAHALLKTDGMLVSEKPISVAISNPPDRRNTNSLSSTQGSISELSLGGGSGDKNFGERRRTQLSFLPRSVKITDSNKMDVSESQSIINKKSMTNEDFKKALF